MAITRTVRTRDAIRGSEERQVRSIKDSHGQASIVIRYSDEYVTEVFTGRDALTVPEELRSYDITYAEVHVVSGKWQFIWAENGVVNTPIEVHNLDAPGSFRISPPFGRSNSSLDLIPLFWPQAE